MSTHFADFSAKKTAKKVWLIVNIFFDGQLFWKFWLTFGKKKVSQTQTQTLKLRKIFRSFILQAKISKLPVTKKKY